MPIPRTESPSGVRMAGGVERPSRGKTTAVGPPPPSACASTSSSADEVPLHAPCNVKTVPIAVRAVGDERLGPAQLVEDVVDRVDVPCLDGVAERALEELLFAPVHHVSGPSSSSRRAMMLRWISAVPP